jgi:prepilin-type N-terminal cleavage/methylation domain-containing protein
LIRDVPIRGSTRGNWRESNEADVSIRGVPFLMKYKENRPCAKDDTYLVEHDGGVMAALRTGVINTGIFFLTSFGAKGSRGRGRRRSGGFTLIETLVALSIFTVGIMAVGAMLIYSNRARVFNRQLNVAVTMTQQRIDELRKIGEGEIDVRYNSVLNFNYLLSRSSTYGTIDGYVTPGLLSGAAGYTAAIASILSNLPASEDPVSAPLYPAIGEKKQKRRDQLKILYDDGDLANHGDATSGDGIWSSIDYINMDTGEVKPQPEYTALMTTIAAMSEANKRKYRWKWVLKRRTIVEPVKLVEVTGATYKRTLSHATLSATVTDNTGADVVRLTVESSWVDMTGKTRTITFSTLISRGST